MRGGRRRAGGLPQLSKQSKEALACVLSAACVKAFLNSLHTHSNGGQILTIIVTACGGIQYYLLRVSSV